MDARGFDHLTKLVSRRGLAAVLGGGLLAGHARGAAKHRKKRRKPCGGRPTDLTRHCRAGGGECENDENCAAGCACVERQISCCRRVQRKRGKRPTSKLCIDGSPGLYCVPAP